MSPWSSTVTSTPARPRMRPTVRPTGPPPAMMILSLSFTQLEFPVDLDCNPVRKLGHPDRRARVLAVLRTEQLVEEVRCPVDHLRHPIKPGRCIDHAEQSHDAFDPIEITELRLEARQHGQRDGARG